MNRLSSSGVAVSGRLIKKMIKAVFLVVTLGLMVLSIPLAAMTLTCIPNQKFICSKDGCEVVPAGVRVVIDMDKQTYSRCDKNGCDKYDSTVSVRGIYLNFDVGGKSTFTKVEISSMQYFEIVSLGFVVYTSFGKCSYKLAPK